MKSFKDFTNLYSLSKTLRLELKPTLETEAILKKLGVWCAKDEKKAKEKTVVKFYMDILHREFTEEALKRISLDLEKFFELFWEFKQIQNQSSPTKEVKKFKENNIKDKRNELKNEFKKLAIKFKEAFDETDQNWRDKYKDLGKTIKNEKSKSYLILSENVLNYLKNRFSQEEVEELREQDKKHLEEYQDVVNSDGENIFDNFKGFFGYFDSLIDNRGNFYKTDEKAARISTRAINENLSFFAENIYTFKTYFTDTLLEEITEKEKETFEENFYNKCLLQEGIKNYNLVIGDINKKLNKYNQQNDKKIPSLKTLYKQTLSLEENEDYKHIEIKNDNDFITVVEEFIEINSEKTLAGKKIFNSFITRCLSRNNLDQIYLPKDSVNTIAYRVFKPIEEIMQLFKNKYFVPLQEIEVLTKSNEWQKMLKESEEKEKHLIFKDSVSKSISPTNDIFANFIRILEEEYKKQFIGFEKETRRGQTKFVGYNEALNNLKGKLEWFKDKKARNQKLSNDEKIEIKKDRHPYHLKRYSENKIFLHFPIQLNADVYVPEDVNTRILELLSKKTSIKIIGIDRGEKNLAYYSVISQTTDGKIKVEDCGDLNLGYLEPLDKLGIERQEQRRAWQSISEIKSKRNGYISHAVHKIANLILDHEAIVVFEDLSGGFKRSRMKIEKAPY